MSLATYFDGKLLTKGKQARVAFARLENGFDLRVTLQLSPQPVGQPHLQLPKDHFTTQLGWLPPASQKKIRNLANVIQKQVYDSTPEYDYPPRTGGGLRPRRNARNRPVNGSGRPITYRPPAQMPVRLEKPPKQITLNETLVLEIVQSSTYNNEPALEIGRPLVVVYRANHNSAKHDLGVIKEFVLH